MLYQPRLFVVVLAVACPLFALAQESEKPSGPFFVDGQDPKPAGMAWTPVESLSDEFNGDSIDLGKWQTDPMQNGWGWIGRPPGLFRAENVVVADGNMNVTVSKLPRPRQVRRSRFVYQGAIVRSLEPGHVGWYYETRMKANKTAMSSTFWLNTKSRRPMGQELDIQECVGSTNEKTESWAKTWDQVFHSNLIRWQSFEPRRTQNQGSVATPTKNHERFYVYAAWWKSPDEVQFFLDGQYKYSIKPSAKWNLPAHIHMAIETYDWNPVPDDGGLVARGTWEERTTKYDWVRVWKLK